MINSVNSVAGTLYNGVSFVNGRFNNALKFDGINDYGDLNFDPPDPVFTNEFWIKFDTVMPTTQCLFYPYGAFIWDHSLRPHYDTIPCDTIIQASNLTFSNITNNQFTFNWTDGNGTNRVAFIKEDTEGSASPVNNATYTPNTAFGSGSQIGTTGWYCVFNGTTHPDGITVTNLSPCKTYRIMVCDYTGSPGSEIYNTSTAFKNPENVQTSGSVIIPTDGLVGYWPFNGNANDESGYGNNGTVYGATFSITLHLPNFTMYHLNTYLTVF